MSKINANEGYQNLIKDIFYKVKQDDKDLPKDVNERAFVFRFGHYLANYIEQSGKYKVDVEYNRKEIQPKRKSDKLIVPDLIVHIRGTNDNLIAIEFKKSNDNKNDKEKLKFLMLNNAYLYREVYFIVINKNKIEKLVDNEWKSIIGDNNE